MWVIVGSSLWLLLVSSCLAHTPRPVWVYAPHAPRPKQKTPLEGSRNPNRDRWERARWHRGKNRNIILQRTKMEPTEGNLSTKTKRDPSREPLYNGRVLPFIGQGEGRVNMWDNPLLHGILCPELTPNRRLECAPNFYTNLQEWVHTLHPTDSPNIFRFLTMCRKLHDNGWHGHEWVDISLVRARF